MKASGLVALFGDGAGALIVGVGFELVSAAQTVRPNSDSNADGHASGLVFRPSFKLPETVRDNAKECLVEGVGPHVLGGGWNDLFWAVHPGGRKILGSVEEGLALALGKLHASRRVLSQYGNMSGASIIFVLDELRRHDDMPQGGLGVMPGISIETMLLRAAAA
ncbi:hypothetical protein E2562_021854 [Oryza meyeriana var. granulata]|uniref:Chalcone/stilbene synthase C-terminal domain-containing protein n=1 Tax=Oryza meyeriana var. granulata TaxID=110450 RepID=A0A6G1C8K1_9ORYZ|nr:hypothetical protein E2562_021854 [Oryza meyeriana var. granulata]